MATLFYFGTHGFENPTKVTMPLFLANGALEGKNAEFINPKQLADLMATADQVIAL